MLMCNVKIVTVNPLTGVIVVKAKLLDFTIEHALKYFGLTPSPDVNAFMTNTDDIVIEVKQLVSWHITIPRVHTFIAVP